MYAIFAPLDPNERLPRELVLEGRRHTTLGRLERWPERSRLPALFLILGFGRLGSPNSCAPNRTIISSHVMQ